MKTKNVFSFYEKLSYTEEPENSGEQQEEEIIETGPGWDIPPPLIEDYRTLEYYQNQAQNL